MEKTLKEICNEHRASCLQTEKAVRALMDHGVFAGEQAMRGQHGEMKANIMLTVRHLEDARMRLGKVIQYYEGGVSCYDKDQTQPYPA